MNIIYTDTNTYALSFERECICYLSKPMMDIINCNGFSVRNIVHTENEDVDINYYIQKYEYLKKYGIIEPVHSVKLAQFTEEQIEWAFFNTPSIVFEVTESCNMDCSYCIYGDMYNFSSERGNRYLNAYQMINAIRAVLSKRDPINHHLNVGFYGGEPLLYFKDIEKVILTLSSEISQFEIGWLMTTNASLLTEEICDFCAANNIDLLISLDGDRKSNKYRVFKNGKPTYDRVSRNINNLKTKYPDYFKKRVNFNSVLATDITVDEIVKYFNQTYSKTPILSNLSTLGAKIGDKSIESVLSTSEEADENKIGAEMIPFMENLTHNICVDISSMLKKSKISNGPVQAVKYFIPTGSCIPFGKKIFITAAGVIKPCEKIPLDFDLGFFDGKNIEIKFDKVAKFYNSLYQKIWSECQTCGKLYNCNRCIFHIPQILTNSNIECDQKQDNAETCKRYGELCNFIEENPAMYKTFIDINY